MRLRSCTCLRKPYCTLVAEIKRHLALYADAHVARHRNARAHTVNGWCRNSSCDHAPSHLAANLTSSNGHPSIEQETCTAHKKVVCPPLPTSRTCLMPRLLARIHCKNVTHHHTRTHTQLQTPPPDPSVSTPSLKSSKTGAPPLPPSFVALSHSVTALCLQQL